MVEIEIISGFLGAGKTTFLNQYLPLLSGKTVVIENECGEVSLDSGLFPKEIPVKEIYGGCICCSLMVDLQTGIKELIERFHPDRIIIEPSGLGRLSDIMKACERICETEKEEIMINKKITIVDAQSYDEFVDGFGVFYSDQIQYADILLLGRVEGMDKSAVERIAEDLAQKNPDAVLYCDDLRNMESQNLKKICEIKGKTRRREEVSDEDEFQMSWYGNFFQTITIRQPKQMSEEELGKVLEHLKKETNGRVLRAKGRIEISEHRFLKFDFTMSDSSYKEVAEGSCGVVVIGLRLNQPAIESMFQEHVSAGLAMIKKFKREGGRKKMKSQEDYLKRLSDCVCDMEEDEILDVVKEYIDAGYDPQEGMLKGLVDGMKRASVLYEEGEYFVPELIVCSDAMYAGIEELQKYLPETEKQCVGKVAIGVVEGDTHDIGKNLVRIMMETGGFEVDDLGRDVDLEKFVDYVREHDVDILCMSSLMTTTMPGMKTVIDRLNEEGLRDKVKIMVGGAPVSPAFAKKIGADGYTRSAVEAVEFAKKLMEVQ